MIAGSTTHTIDQVLLFTNVNVFLSYAFGGRPAGEYSTRVGTCEEYQECSQCLLLLGGLGLAPAPEEY